MTLSLAPAACSARSRLGWHSLRLGPCIPICPFPTHPRSQVPAPLTTANTWTARRASCDHGRCETDAGRKACGRPNEKHTRSRRQSRHRHRSGLSGRRHLGRRLRLLPSHSNTTLDVSSVKERTQQHSRPARTSIFATGTDPALAEADPRSSTEHRRFAASSASGAGHRALRSDQRRPSVGAPQVRGHAGTNLTDACTSRGRARCALTSLPPSRGVRLIIELLSGALCPTCSFQRERPSKPRSASSLVRCRRDHLAFQPLATYHSTTWQLSTSRRCLQDGTIQFAIFRGPRHRGVRRA